MQTISKMQCSKGLSKKYNKKLLVSGPCHVGNTSSHSNTEIMQHWARIVLGWETTWEIQVLPTKTTAGLRSESMYAKQMCGKLFQGVLALGKSGLCSRQLSGNCCKAVPRSTWMGPNHVEPWKSPNPVMKVWQIKEDLCWKVTGSKLGARDVSLYSSWPLHFLRPIQSNKNRGFDDLLRVREMLNNWVSIKNNR